MSLRSEGGRASKLDIFFSLVLSYWALKGASAARSTSTVFDTAISDRSIVQRKASTGTGRSASFRRSFRESSPSQMPWTLLVHERLNAISQNPL